MSHFVRRAWCKAKEHLRNDKTGWSLLKYSFKWLFSRMRRRVRAGFGAPTLGGGAEIPSDRVLVGVKVTGGIGDYIVVARALRDLAAGSDALRFHVYTSHTDSGEWVFKALPCVEGVFDAVFFANVRTQYDCAMYMHQFVYYDEEYLNLQKVRRLAPAFLRALARARASRARWDIFIERHPSLDGAFAHTAVACGYSRYSFLSSQFGLAPGPLTLDLGCDDSIADELSSRFQRWVTINTGFDAKFVISAKHATKCYPKKSWEEVVRGIKELHPDLGVVQIGAKTSFPVRGADATFVGGTSLAQAAGVLRRSRLHIDCEGGLVHVAACLGVRSVVLFGPTSKEYFGYPENTNLSSGFCGDCWWATERWMECCPRGYGSPRCLELLDPAKVVEAVASAIGRQDRKGEGVAGPAPGVAG